MDGARGATLQPSCYFLCIRLHRDWWAASCNVGRVRHACRPKNGGISKSSDGHRQNELQMLLGWDWRSCRPNLPYLTLRITLSCAAVICLPRFRLTCHEYLVCINHSLLREFSKSRIILTERVRDVGSWWKKNWSRSIASSCIDKATHEIIPEMGELHSSHTACSRITVVVSGHAADRRCSRGRWTSRCTPPSTCISAWLWRRFPTNILTISWNYTIYGV